jgi:hypothetical protein
MHRDRLVGGPMALRIAGTEVLKSGYCELVYGKVRRHSDGPVLNVSVDVSCRMAAVVFYEWRQWDIALNYHHHQPGPS